MNTTICLEDSDCNGTELCYVSNLSWVDENFCGCNSWFGWEGETCEDLGVGSYVYMASLIVSSSIALRGCYLAFTTILLQFRVISRDASSRKRSAEVSMTATDGARTSRFPSKGSKPAMPRKAKQKKLNPISFTAILALLGMLSFLAYRILMFVVLMTPNNFLFREEVGIEGDAKAHKFEENIEPKMVIVVGVFVVSSMMNLSLVWISNVNKMKKFSAKQETRLIGFKGFLAFFNLIWISLFIILDPADAGAVVIVFTVLVSISYFLAEIYLQKLRKFVTGDSDIFNKKNIWVDGLIRRMRNTRRGVVFGSVLSVIGAGIYLGLSIETSWREYAIEGDVSFAMVGNELMILGIGVSQFSIVVFLYNLSSSPILPG